MNRSTWNLPLTFNGKAASTVVAPQAQRRVAGFHIARHSGQRSAGSFSQSAMASSIPEGASGGVRSRSRLFSNFSAASGFHSGLNTLDFVVTNVAQNGGNPTGLRVEFTASNVTPVPEPETYAMLLAGLGLMGVISRRRAKRNAA